MIIMSGFFIPIDNMPFSLQAVTYLNPMRYFMAIIRDIFQKGSDFLFLGRDVIIMTLYGIMIITMAVFKFRKRIS
jgi:ABC-2 type transport system permease protein